jgi:hypothetical protein
MLGLAIFPSVQPPAASAAGAFAQVFWQQRGLDVLGQVVLLFVAALGVLTLIGGASLPADGLPTLPKTYAEPAEPERERMETHA